MPHEQQGSAIPSPNYLANAVKVVGPWLHYQRYIDQIPGISVGIVHKGRIVFCDGYGYANLRKRVRATADTRYRVASISKVFTATAVMKLVECGKLRLDDRVQDRLDHFKGDSGHLSRITVRHLLTHFSGLTRDGKTPHWVDFKFPSLEVVLHQFRKENSFFEPLEQFKYSNFAFGLLGRVIENRTHNTYKRFVREEIIDRLHLDNTYVDLESEALGSLATGYGRRFPGTKREEFDHVETKALAPATGFISNVPDLCKFLSALFDPKSKLLSGLSRREMQTICWNREDDSEGYELGLSFWKMNGKRILGHSGGFPGFATRLGMDREVAMGVVVLTNAQDGPARDLMEGIFHILDYFRKRDGSHKTLRPRRDLERYEGMFSSRWYDLQIVAVGSQLIGFDLGAKKPLERPLELQPLANNNFKIVSGDEFGYIGEGAKFEFDGDGKISRIRLGPNPMKAVDPRTFLRD